jgi:two-component system response regulator MprA
MIRPHTQPPSAPQSRSHSIVLVDDDPALVETLEDLLSTEGYRVEGFTDPAEALARLRRGDLPDLIILDCLMPGLTGTEMLAALRESGIDVPALLMTALADPSFCVNPGDAEVIHKPFVLEDLLLEMEARLRPRSGAPRAAARGAARV